MRTVHLISGLPRSGSTLLCNLLDQNPRFLVRGTSPLVDMMLTVRAAWARSPEARAMDTAAGRHSVLKLLQGMFAHYYDVYSHRPSPGSVAFDKSRSWLAHLDMAEECMGPLKVLVPVRDVRDVLASFEKLWRASAWYHQNEWEARYYHQFQTVAGRCGVWMSPEGPVGIAVARVLDAIHRGFGDRMLMVPYEALTRDPAGTMGRVYEFLGEEPFTHDFENVEQRVQEDDRAYGFPGLHTIRSRVEPSPSRWRELLGDVAEQYAPLNGFLFPRPLPELSPVNGAIP